MSTLPSINRPAFVDVELVEPTVIDLTVHDGHPEFSVRMPIFNSTATHDDDYFELRYKRVRDAVVYILRPSDRVLRKLVEARELAGSAPLTDFGEVGMTANPLGTAHNLAVVLKKLCDYHDSGAIKKQFARYKRS